MATSFPGFFPRVWVGAGKGPGIYTLDHITKEKSLYFEICFGSHMKVTDQQKTRVEINRWSYKKSLR